MARLHSVVSGASILICRKPSLFTVSVCPPGDTAGTGRLCLLRRRTCCEKSKLTYQKAKGAVRGTAVLFVESFDIAIRDSLMQIGFRLNSGPMIPRACDGVNTKVFQNFRGRVGVSRVREERNPGGVRKNYSFRDIRLASWVSRGGRELTDGRGRRFAEAGGRFLRDYQGIEAVRIVCGAWLRAAGLWGRVLCGDCGGVVERFSLQKDRG